VFPGISAISGAKIVATLATKLQIPIADAQNRVGNVAAWLAYTKLNADAIPKDAISTRPGKTQAAKSSLYPKHAIRVPPAVANVK
jgi:hypothetical protein